MHGCWLILFFMAAPVVGRFDEEHTQASSKTNIKFVLTDDQRWESMGVMENPIIKTSDCSELIAIY